MKKRLLALLLVLVMLLGMVPMSALAAEAEDPAPEEIVEVVSEAEPEEEAPIQEPEEEAPAAEPEAPAQEPEAPAEEPEAPAAEPEAPIQEPEEETPAQEPEEETPAAEPETPAQEPEAPVEEPEPLTEEPVLAQPEEPTREGEGGEDPAEDPTPESDPLTIDYTGDAFTVIKADGSAFGMFTPWAGTTVAVNGDKVDITFYPKNGTIYKGFYLNTLITAETPDEANYIAGAASSEAKPYGLYTFTVSAELCGKAVAISPIKADGSGTTTTQYYLAIPAADKLPYAVTVASVTVKTMPDKTEYAVGEPFDPTGLVISATLSSGAAGDIAAAEYTLSQVDTSSAGEKTVTVTYGDQTATFTVTVKEAETWPKTGAIGSGVWSLSADGVLTISKGEGDGDLSTASFNWTLRPEFEPYVEQIVEIVIDEGITLLGSQVFQSYIQVKKITLPDGFRSAGSLTFQNCTALETLIVPKSMVQFGSNAIFGCNGIKTVIYGGSELDWIALSERDPTAMYTLNTLAHAEITYEGGTVTAIELSGYQTEYYLYGWLDLTGTTVTATLSTGEKQEMNLSLVEASVLDSSTPGEKTVTVTYKEISTTITVIVKDEIGVGATGYCGAEGNGENMTWTVTTDGILTISGVGEMCNDYVQYIMSGSTGSFAPWYEYADRVVSIVIEEGVTSLGQNAFVHKGSNGKPNYTYDNLASLSMPASLKTIGEGAFTNLPLSGTLTLPDTIENIGSSAFSSCLSLESVVINCNVTGNGVFQSCTGLKSAVVNGDLIGEQTFARCSALETVTFGSAATKIPGSTFLRCSGLSDITIPENIKEIGSNAFERCTKLTTVTVPAGTTVGSSVFSRCTGLTTATVGGLGASMFSNCSALTEVTILEGVTKMPDSLFSNCKKLQKVYIPASVTEYGSNMFSGIDPLPEFEGPGAEAAAAYLNYQTEENGIVYSGDYSALISVPASFEGVLVIRDGVTKIMSSAANGCAGLTAVQFPDSIRSIGENAFSNCTGLTSIVIPEGVTVIASSTFSGCSALTTITLPSTLTVIETSAFRSCGALTSIEIPEGVMSLGALTFMDCSILTHVSLPSTLKEFGNNCFGGCIALSSIAIPEGVAELPDNCFYNTGLESIVIPSSVKTIGMSAIPTSGALKTIYYTGSYDEFDAIIWTSDYTHGILETAELICYYGPQGDPSNAPVITAQPEDKTFALNADATDALLVTVQAAAEGERLYLDWFSKASESAVAKHIVSTHSEDGLTATVTPSTAEKGNTYYYCLVTKIAVDGSVTQTVSDTVCVTVSGDIGLDGSGSATDPYQIKGLEELEILRQLINEGETFQGTWFKLMNDIVLPSEWTPLGKNPPEPLPGRVNTMVPFVGNLDGGGNTVTIAEGGRGLFGYVRETVVTDLKLYSAGAATPLLVAYACPIDYGDDNNYSTGAPRTLDVIDCTIIEGSVIDGPGFIVSSGSSANEVTFTNCTVEKASVKNGSFAKGFVGTMTGCVSYADVTGDNRVGGLVGYNNNSTGKCYFTNCTFAGTVTATGNNVGGIIGQGYEDATAPNTCLVWIDNCTMSGSVTGVNNIGGLLGSEGGLQQNYNAASKSSITGNTVTGTVTATGKNAGALAGLYSHLERFTYIDDNDYSACNVTLPFGRVYHVDTSAVEFGWHDVPGMADQVFYFDSSRTDYTAEQLETIYNALWTGWEDTNRYKPSSFAQNRNRFDDPLAVGDPGEIKVKSLVISGEYKTDYLVGDEFDKTGITVTANYSDGSSKDVTAEAEFTGFDSKTPGDKEISVVFGGAFVTFHVTVRLPEGTVTVKLSVLGDEHHTVTGDADIHGLWVGGLTEWLPETEVNVVNSNDEPATVWKLLNQVFDADESLTLFARESTYGQYIYAVQKDDLKLEEKENVPADSAYLSGWMYAVNGKHIQLAVDKCFLQEGDVVILHWCDDSTIDEAAGAQQEQQDQQAAYAVEDMIFAIPAEITLADEEAIVAARAAYDALTDAQKARVDADALAALEAAEARLAALKMGKTTVTAKNLKAGTIKLTWTALDGAEKYNVYVSTSKDGTYKLAGTVTGKTYTYKSGSVGKRYYFKVTGVNAEGIESEESSPVSRYRLPDQVKSLKAKSTKAKQVTLTWKKVSGAKKYYIYMSKNGKTGWKKVGTATKTTFTYKKGTSGKTLYFKVQAVSSSGKKGEFSTVKKIKVK